MEMVSEDCPKEPKLHAAVRKRDHDLVVRLLKKRPKTVEKEKGLCCSMLSSVGNMLRCRNVLIDAKNSRSETPLHIAARSNWFELVKTLLEAGADANIRDREGNTPLDLAVNNSCSESTEIFLHQASETNSDKHENLLHIAVKLNKLGLIDELLDRGYNVNVRNDLKQTPLHAAVTSRNIEPEVIKKLVDRGANKNAKDSRGRTPFQCAMRHVRGGAVEELVVEPPVTTRSWWRWGGRK